MAVGQRPLDEQFVAGDDRNSIAPFHSSGNTRAVRIPAAHETDVIAEHVELLGVGERHFHFVDLVLNVVEPLH